MKFTLPFILFIAASFSAFSQTVTISGKITDQQNKPVPFASVYIKNTTKGTSANSEGEYTLQLTPGAYDIQYKAVGYRQQSHAVELNKNTTADIVL